MTRDDVVRRIRVVLHQRLLWPHLNRFSDSARLNQDLYLDSILLLELLVHLELDFGFAIPDRALEAHHFATVGSLADLLLTLPREGAGRLEGGAA